jgi:type II secretory pathway pseudopilin PulG
VSRVRSERGEMSLIGLLVAISIFGGVLGSTLTLFQGFDRVSRATADRSDAQDRTRQAIDQLVRELRNLASPTQEKPDAVDVAGPYDLVFQTVDALGPNAGLNASNVMRVRYCLTTSTTNALLYRQTQRWTTAATPLPPSTATCPGSGWGTTTVASDHIVNGYNNLARPVFTYNGAAAADVSTIHADLFVDLDVTKQPLESRLSSGVFLRNQNRRPSAIFDTPGKTSTGLILNGSESTDPEGEPLTYVWYDGSTKIGDGIVFNYTVAKGTTHNISLKVYDPGGLEGVAASVQVTA